MSSGSSAFSQTYDFIVLSLLLFKLSFLTFAARYGVKPVLKHLGYIGEKKLPAQLSEALYFQRYGAKTASAAETREQEREETARRSIMLSASAALASATNKESFLKGAVRCSEDDSDK